MASPVAAVVFDQGDDVLGRAVLQVLARLARSRRNTTLLVRTGYMMTSSQSGARLGSAVEHNLHDRVRLLTILSILFMNLPKRFATIFRRSR